MALLALVLISLVWAGSVYCEEYLVALSSSSGDVYISATVGQTEGSVNVQHPDMKETFQVGPYSRRLVTIPPKALTKPGLGNGSIIVNTSSDAVTVNGYYRYSGFSSLPISALGTRYIVSHCRTGTSVLVIAAYDRETEVEITFRLPETLTYAGKNYMDGDKFTQHLDPFETFSFNIPTPILTGTVVQTTSPVAVYMGSTYKSHVVTYEQVLPVSAHGKEYVVATDENTYTLQIVGDHSDTHIDFSDGRSVSQHFYWQVLEKNRTLYFNSSRPVMATLCKYSSRYYDSNFATLPPVRSFRLTEASVYIPYAAITSTVKILTTKSSSLKVNQYSQQVPLLDWSIIKDSQYKIWTCKEQNNVATSFSSNESFNLLIYSPYFLQNGGYTYSGGDGVTKPGTDSSDIQTTTVALPSSMPDRGGSNASMIVGIVCGVIIVVLLVIIAVLIYHRKRTHKEDTKPSPPPPRPAVQSGVANPAVVYAGDNVDEAPYTELVNTVEHNYEKV